MECLRTLDLPCRLSPSRSHDPRDPLRCANPSTAYHRRCSGRSSPHPRRIEHRKTHPAHRTPARHTLVSKWSKLRWRDIRHPHSPSQNRRPSRRPGHGISHRGCRRTLHRRHCRGKRGIFHPTRRPPRPRYSQRHSRRTMEWHLITRQRPVVSEPQWRKPHRPPRTYRSAKCTKDGPTHPIRPNAHRKRPRSSWPTRWRRPPTHIDRMGWRFPLVDRHQLAMLPRRLGRRTGRRPRPRLPPSPRPEPRWRKIIRTLGRPIRPRRPPLQTIPPQPHGPQPPRPRPQLIPPTRNK